MPLQITKSPRRIGAAVLPAHRHPQRLIPPPVGGSPQRFIAARAHESAWIKELRPTANQEHQEQNDGKDNEDVVHGSPLLPVAFHQSNRQSVLEVSAEAPGRLWRDLLSSFGGNATRSRNTASDHARHQDEA
jgi:hypothetical protein